MMRLSRALRLALVLVVAVALPLGSMSSANAEARPTSVDHATSPPSRQSDLHSSNAANFSCLDGYACLYASYCGNGTPMKWKKYGAHNLSGVKGTHCLLNNQTGSAAAYACTDYDGNGSCQLVKAGKSLTRDFTAIDSIYLSARPLALTAGRLHIAT